MPRNPLLFGLLYRMDVVENIGSGIKRIRDLCREHGVSEPRIDVSEHWVTVTFRRPAARDGDRRRADADTSGAGLHQRTHDSTNEAQADHVQEVEEAQVAIGEDAPTSDGRGLQEWEIGVLKACAEQPATGRELLSASGCSTRTGNLKRLMERHLASDLL